MRILSLYDGISCAMLALKRAGISVSRYVAYEIDKYAVACSKANWPGIEHRGNVIGADFSEFAGFDIVLGGFPCQDLSRAGRLAGLKGKRSVLFWYLVEAIKIVHPRYFLVENNVGMPKEAENTITEALGVAPIQIDSALVSAQSRKRLYWTNIPGVEQPEDRGILLKDILEDRVPLKYIHSRLAVDYLFRAKMNQRFIQDAIRNKSICITANFCKGVPYNVIKIDGGRLGTTYYRKLTPTECERLQTLLEGYTGMLSDTRRYKAIGNGWTVDVVAHILNYINLDELI